VALTATQVFWQSGPQVALLHWVSTVSISKWGTDMADNEAARRAGPNGQMEKRIRQTMEQKDIGQELAGEQARLRRQGLEPGRAMGAQAYATGNDVAFKKQPDLQTAAHEAAHVMQQRAPQSPQSQQSAARRDLGSQSAESAKKSLLKEVTNGSTPPHEGRVVLMMPAVQAPVEQSLGAAHATVKNLANLEQAQRSK